MADNGEQQPSGPPDYKVYRSRRGLLSRLRSPDLSGLRERTQRCAEAAWRRDGPKPRARPARRGRWTAKRVLKWVGIAALGWIVLSFLAFAVSAQLQSFKLSGEAKDALHGNPFLLPSAQTILVLGTDARPPDTKEPGAAPLAEVLRTAVARRRPPRRLRSRRIPRRHADADPRRRRHLPQTLDPARQLRRNPRPEPAENQRRLRLRRRQALQIKTVENFLGIQIDHVAIVDFTGFEDLIDAVGGVEVDVPHKLCADISGGAGGGQGGVTLRLQQGREHARRRKGPRLLADPRAERMPRPGQERLLARLQRLRPREGPAGR